MALVKRKVTHSGEPGRPEQPRNREELAAALEGADTGARREAAQDIVHCLDAANSLVNRLKREGDAAVREAILNSLVRLNDPSAIGGLAECLRSEDAALRNDVIETFRQLGGDV